MSDYTHDTIAAIATAPGAAGLAVVRVSGTEAFAIASRVFPGTDFETAQSHTLHHGWAEDGDGTRLDEVVVGVFRAPRSYTRENVVEVSCHGGRLPAERVLDALISAGARLARPGEFTLRAFLNGRIDLAQAEAVADLIQARTEEARALAVMQLAGALSRQLDEITERILNAVAEVEARVDFAEDVGGVEVPENVIAEIGSVREALSRLLEGAHWARAVREGVRVALVGRPNVGKSSLFNALVGEDRAIVTAVAGTTRDRVSETIEIRGVPVTLSDTAGMRESGDEVETIGIARARAAIEESAVVLWVIDGTEALNAEDRAIAAAVSGKPLLAAINKRDAERVLERSGVETLLNGAPHRLVELSALTGEGVAAVREALAQLLGVDKADRGVSEAVSNRRHVDALERARAALTRATKAAKEGAAGELVAVDLNEALEAVGEVTGRSLGEDLLDRIFSRFCVGK